MIADPQDKGLPPKAFNGHLERMGIIDKALLLYYGMLIKIWHLGIQLKLSFWFIKYVIIKVCVYT